MHNRLFRFLSAAIFLACVQTAVIGYQVGERTYILRTGTEIRLKTEAVDPRDVLRGDYVVLNYAISHLRRDQIVGPIPVDSKEIRFNVRLVSGADGFAVVQEASVEPLPPKHDSVVLVTEPVSFLPGMATNGTIAVRYGIERFYLPEGEGKAVEQQRNQGAVTVAARVSMSGKVQLRQLFVDGQAVYQEPDF
ncbi:GDYXXLXY domain-containing protein [Rhizobium sp.]|jgi:uncharacterized membrane-anchored protein|uniref:GDYXXLXY domain-containing protein n=1 Tax=Rhizobium sp. TaxID=391 RepID=UPI000E8201ED|nr:hypothetical protein [Rhizobium sp.]